MLFERKFSKMTDDIRLNINDWWNGKANNLPPAPWTYPEPSGGYDANNNPKCSDVDNAVTLQYFEDTNTLVMRFKLF